MEFIQPEDSELSAACFQVNCSDCSESNCKHYCHATKASFSIIDESYWIAACLHVMSCREIICAKCNRIQEIIRRKHAG
jgi:hypothetical protein